MSGEIWQLGATGLRDRYARRDISPREVVDALARRIEQTDPYVRAFTTLTLDRALRDADARTAELARGDRLGPLHGIPVAVKELFDVGGAVTTYGSAIFADHRPVRDAAAVQALRQAGAIVMGLTRSHEFGWGITTQHPVLGGTRNPWDLSRVPGGSSGGSAAALATGMVPLALGTDTGGSIRIPAGYCGVAGLKPSYGRISAAGVVPLAPSLDHPGPMARTSADLGLAFLALTEEMPGAGGLGERGMIDAAEAAGKLAGLGAGIVPDLHLTPLAPDHRKIFDRAVTAIEGAGAIIRELGVADAGELRPAFAAIQMAEAHHVHHRILGLFPGRAAAYGADVRRRLEMAADVTLDQYLTASDGARRARREFASLLRQSDVLITPVAGGGPSLIASPDTSRAGGHEVAFRDLVMDYTVPQNLTGLPACVIPAGFDDDGIPVGLQVTAGPGGDLTALRVAAGLEAVLSPGPRQWPDVSRAS